MSTETICNWTLAVLLVGFSGVLGAIGYIVGLIIVYGPDEDIKS